MSEPTTEMIDRLYLELSQFTHATTKREAELQAEIDALRERLVEADYELSGEAAHEAPGLTYRTVRVGVEWYESWRARPEVVRALEEER